MLLLLLACAHPTDLTAAYQAAVEDARYPTPEEVVGDLLTLTRETPGLVWDERGRVLVSTWTRSSYFADPKYQPGYIFPLYGETFFTAGEEVAEVCRASGLSGEALSLRLEMLLGLPPGGGRDAFLQVWITPEALRRPCAEPDVAAPSCPIAPPLYSDGPGSVYWVCEGKFSPATTSLCAAWVNRYGASDPMRRYPFTALGYTYDWSGDGDEVGPSEFVANAATPVEFAALIPTETFCASP